MRKKKSSSAAASLADRERCKPPPPSCSSSTTRRARLAVRPPGKPLLALPPTRLPESFVREKVRHSSQLMTRHTRAPQATGCRRKPPVGALEQRMLLFQRVRPPARRPLASRTERPLAPTMPERRATAFSHRTATMRAGAEARSPPSAALPTPVRSCACPAPPHKRCALSKQR